MIHTNQSDPRDGQELTKKKKKEKDTRITTSSDPIERGQKWGEKKNQNERCQTQDRECRETREKCHAVWQGW